MSDCKNCKTYRPTKPIETPPHSIDAFEWGKPLSYEEVEATDSEELTDKEISKILLEIQHLSVSGDAFDFASSKMVYEFLKENLKTIYISDVYVEDEELEKTFYVIAKNEEEYEKYEEKVEHQHHPEIGKRLEEINGTL